ncbi:Benomyl/methotrexate resistance protein [Wickerhamomyces ciferrii]|uniref:Benomyl/methotrexate resistance protein n=1 Tax=Wickerhamomyces ciferrii (strain ATCC 14091 / BCRC 22168 / CBS 111 / JCM 3599 / NBRC 0793 / NRRL Y-1031 F-60-10) TaxID=1206466 RepID=K0KKR2_WICCF|nr:Benomyl/methotrexate resistance protein [Wickerhamomyces ciferrii]CCH45765.1 Benomyl/methotrexate resistance protein [Wickerhamomyces ciferrii]
MSSTGMIKFILRAGFLGKLINKASSGKFLIHKEDEKDYVIPEKYLLNQDEYESNDKEEEFIGTGSPNSTSTTTYDLDSKYIIVTWDGEDDPENPNNWPLPIRIYVSFITGVMSTFTYIASANYTPGMKQLQEEFKIDQTKATLPLSLFVIGYGIGPMIFSPLSEHKSIGRVKIFIVTLFIFAILQIPTALAKNITSLTILRFISGIFSSPSLAMGGGVFVDMYSLPYMPVGIALWGIGAYLGVSLGPVVGAALQVGTNDWRWSFWFLLIVSAALFVIYLTFIPETYHPMILNEKAERLRRLTGNPNIVVQQDIDSKNQTVSESIREILWRPIEIGIFEPVILLINIYISILYAIMYLWFEAFPYYYGEIRGFGTMTTGLTYLSIVTGTLIGVGIYIFVTFRQYTNPMLRDEPIYPEVFIPISIFGSILLPVGIFIFGWSATSTNHWFGSLIGGALYGASGLIMFQTLLNYIGMSFFRFVASAFASNAFMRSVVGGCFPLFGRAFFKNLSTKKFPVAWGSTILGVLTLLLISVPVLFYINGPKLRATSKYSGTGEKIVDEELESNSERNL